MQAYSNSAVIDLSAFKDNMERKERQGSIFFLRPEQICAELSHNRPNTNKIIRLAAQIRRYGLSEPLLVRTLNANAAFPQYALVQDEDAFRAACLAEVGKLPCTIAPETPQTGTENHVFAQIRGKTLHIFEQALAFRLLMEEFSLTQEEIARRSGLSQSAVANKLRLLHLDPDEQQEILRAKLSERHARALLRLKEKEDRRTVLSAIIQEKLTVFATEALIDAILEQKKAKSSADAASNLSHMPCETPKQIPVAERAPEGVLPRKFAMQTLQPLYNSIERTLSIFRKTGRKAEMSHVEGQNEVCITIRIPSKI